MPQILDKSDFFKLLENFAFIRFDFGQKAPRAANGNFKPACYVWAQAAGAAGDVRAMFFLLRLAFWLGLVLLLLPSGGGERGPAANNNVSASQAISAASATVGDLRGFCSRQPDACNVGSQVATTLGYRAQAGAKMLYDVLSEALAPQESAATKQPVEKSSIERASQNTLTPADLAPAWRGPPARKDSRHAA